MSHFIPNRRRSFPAVPFTTLFVLASLLCLTNALFASPPDESLPSSITTLAVQKRWAEAAREIELYRQKHPQSVSAAVFQSETLIRLGLLSDANAILTRILAIHPQSIEALSANAELAQTLGETMAAEKLLLRCTHLAPHSPEVWKRLGDFYLASGRNEALTSFQQAQILAPLDAATTAGVAAAYHLQDRDALANRNFQRAIRQNHTSSKPNATVSLMYGNFLQDKARYRESVTQYSLAIQQDPQSTEVRLGRAKSLVHLSDWDRAAADLKLCLTQSDIKSKIAALNLLTRVAQAQGKDEEAKEYAVSAAQLSSDDVAEKASNNQIAAQLQRARAQMIAKHFPEAIEIYERLLKDHADVSEAWLDVGRCHFESGQFDQSESDVQQFLLLQDSSASGHLLLGRILLRQGQPDDARREFLRVQAIDPLLSDAHIGVAASYIVEANFTAAIKELRRFAFSESGNPEAQLMLTEALYKNHQPEHALQTIDRLLKQDPTNRAAIAMRHSLRQPGK